MSNGIKKLIYKLDDYLEKGRSTIPGDLRLVTRAIHKFEPTWEHRHPDWTCAGQGKRGVWHSLHMAHTQGIDHKTWTSEHLKWLEGKTINPIYVDILNKKFGGKKPELSDLRRQLTYEGFLNNKKWSPKIVPPEVTKDIVVSEKEEPTFQEKITPGKTKVVPKEKPIVIAPQKPKVETIKKPALSTVNMTKKNILSALGEKLKGKAEDIEWDADDFDKLKKLISQVNISNYDEYVLPKGKYYEPLLEDMVDEIEDDLVRSNKDAERAPENVDEQKKANLFSDWYTKFNSKGVKYKTNVEDQLQPLDQFAAIGKGRTFVGIEIASVPDNEFIVYEVDKDKNYNRLASLHTAGDARKFVYDLLFSQDIKKSLDDLNKQQTLLYSFLGDYWQMSSKPLKDIEIDRIFKILFSHIIQSKDMIYKLAEQKNIVKRLAGDIEKFHAANDRLGKVLAIDAFVHLGHQFKEILPLIFGSPVSEGDKVKSILTDIASENSDYRMSKQMDGGVLTVADSAVPTFGGSKQKKLSSEEIFGDKEKSDN